MYYKFLCSLSLLPALTAVGKSDAQRPNVIVIVADDLGYGDVSAYGSTTIHTPHIDRLAQQGVCFTNGHATSATSTPSRYGLLTGMYPWKNKNAHILPGDAPLLIGEDQFTMPKMFRHAGYTTAAIGKWHLGMGRGTIDWNRHIAPGAREVGFDYSCLLSATVDRVPTVYVENGDVLGLDPNDPIEVSYKANFEGEPTALTHPELLTRQKWSHGHNNTVINGIGRIGFMRGGKTAIWSDEDMADFLLGKVTSFIDTIGSRPFFLYYGLHEPHVPRVPHPRFVGATTMGPRGDAIVEADWCVGELMRKLEEKNLLENTLIIFTSDNGPVLDDGYQDGAVELVGNHDQNGGYRGGKYSLFEAGTRVPLFLYWKGHVRPRVSTALVSQHDLLASFAALIGEEVPKGLDSENHIQTFLGRKKSGRSGMVIEAMGMLAWRSGEYALLPPYKGAKRNTTGNEVGRVDELSLYHLSSDQHQEVNIARQKPSLLRRLQEDFNKATQGYRK
ncbi:MAG: sulfatase-like hydrolase/transferase [Prevotella sp.]|nr:sulfatase-like hydrolase/transferase [Prevotella sp.]